MILADAGDVLRAVRRRAARGKLNTQALCVILATLCWVFAMLVALLAPSICAASPAPGRVSYVFPGTTQVWCLQVNSQAVHVDGQLWAWTTAVHDPRVVLHLPVAELREGCPK